MAGQNAARVRSPAVAGQFYPAGARECRAEATRYLQPSHLAKPTGKRLFGAIVPHAGWICSGAIAGESIAAIAASQGFAARFVAQGVGAVDLVVVFGAVHTPLGLDRAALDAHARWRDPIRETAVAEDLRGELENVGAMFTVDERFHRHEHAIEVELPLIDLAWPGSVLLPIEVPPIDSAADIGRRVAKRLIELNRSAVFLASSDLTHYGPAYQFAPAGVGSAGLTWALENDKCLLDRVEKFEIEQIVPEVRLRQNACGGGAIAAMMSACREFGATHGKILRHTNSFETLKAVHPQRPDNAVGYAAVVIG